MEYSRIIAVSGLPGLHELISSKSDGAIVRSLDDKATRFVSSRIHNFSHLESIEIYTVRDNVNLVDVLQAMEKSGQSLPDAKDNAAVKKYFEAVYPDLDFDRVYSSDMKKIVKWLEILQKNNVEIKLSEPPIEEEPEAQPAPEAVEEKPAKKVKAADKEKAPAAEEEAPKKKAATKKAAEPAADKPAKTTKAAKEKEAGEEAPKKKAAAKKK
ncbi:MAG: DUF5606 domain-containing protein [Bacteroidota bacterium]|nr:DUF5606 domain-containing protein [Bacteroidota bacterium]